MYVSGHFDFPNFHEVNARWQFYQQTFCRVIIFVMPNALLKKCQVALATEQFIAKFKILFNVFLSILNSCSTDIRILNCSYDETKSKMKSNPGLLLECSNDDHLTIFQSLRGIWSNWIQVRSWRSCCGDSWLALRGRTLWIVIRCQSTWLDLR